MGDLAKPSMRRCPIWHRSRPTERASFGLEQQGGAVVTGLAAKQVKNLKLAGFGSAARSLGTRRTFRKQAHDVAVSSPSATPP